MSVSELTTAQHSSSAVTSLIPDFFRQLFAYREFLKQSVLRDLRTKYKRSRLGYLWTIFHPLAMMGVLAIVFSQIMKMPAKDYAVFLFAGILPWNYFNSTTMMSMGTIRQNARLIGQVPLPKYIFSLSIACSNLVNFVLALIPLLAIMIAVGRPLPWTMFLFPIAILPMFFVIVGVSLVLAACNVFFDDTHHLSEVALNALYFMSPVLYHRDLLPPELVKYLVFNPLFVQIETFRGLFYEGVLPNPDTFMINFAASVLILICGLWFFKRVEDKFLYYV